MTDDAALVRRLRETPQEHAPCECEKCQLLTAAADAIERLMLLPSVEHCRAERAEGKGGCGACALCCKEATERTIQAKAEVARVTKERDEWREKAHFEMGRADEAAKKHRREAIGIPLTSWAPE